MLIQGVLVSSTWPWVLQASRNSLQCSVGLLAPNSQALGATSGSLGANSGSVGANIMYALGEVILHGAASLHLVPYNVTCYMSDCECNTWVWVMVCVMT